MKKLMFFAFCLLSISQVYGNGYLVPDIGGNFSGPTDTNPAAIYWNPSATAFSNGGNIFLDIAPTYQKISYERVDYYPGVEQKKYPETSFTITSPAPLLGFTYTFNEVPLTLGAGVYAHYGRETKWDENGPQRFNGTREFLAGLNVGPSIAYRINNKISVGAAFNYVYSMLTAKTSLALAFGEPTDPFQLEDPTSEVRVHLDNLTASNFSAIFGITAKPVRTLTLGVSYITPYKVKLTGPAKISAGPELSGLFSSMVAGLSDVNVEATQHYPQAINFGVKYLLTKNLESNFIMQWYDWSVNDALVLKLSSPDSSTQSLLDVLGEKRMEFHFVDAINFRIDFRYAFNKDTRIGFGGGFDPSGIPTEYLSPSNLEFDKVQAFVSGEYKISENFKISGGFNHYQNITTRKVSASNIIPLSTGYYRGIIEKLNITLQAMF